MELEPIRRVRPTVGWVVAVLANAEDVDVDKLAELLVRAAASG